MKETGSRNSLRFTKPTLLAERPITPTANELDKGWKIVSATGSTNLWTPPTGKKVIISSYKIVGRSIDTTSDLIALLEYKITKNNIIHWEKLDFLTLVGEDYKEMLDTLPQEQVVTAEEIRISVTGSSNNFSLTCLIEGLEE